MYASVFLCISFLFYDICTLRKRFLIYYKRKIMMNKNKVLAWATFLMIAMGIILICLGAFRYDDIAGWGFATVGIGFFCIAWVFNALKGRV